MSMNILLKLRQIGRVEHRGNEFGIVPVAHFVYFPNASRAVFYCIYLKPIDNDSSDENENLTQLGISTN